MPPGTVKINDTLFVDETEIANIHYREYLYWLEKYDPAKFEKMLPDTTVWFDTLVLNENPAVRYYFRHPGFNSYPIVGVSHEQAIEFCKWRTLAVNFYIFCKENNISDKADFSIESFPIKVYYRLPTKQEWEFLASDKYSIEKYPYGHDNIYRKWRGKKHYKTFNCVYPGKPDSSRSFYTSATKSYWPNSNKMYNTIGNIAEMVAEKGVSKGGSFIHTLEECKIADNQYYTKPERWLGFRCVAVIIK